MKKWIEKPYDFIVYLKYLDDCDMQIDRFLSKDNLSDMCNRRNDSSQTEHVIDHWWFINLYNMYFTRVDHSVSIWDNLPLQYRAEPYNISLTCNKFSSFFIIFYSNILSSLSIRLCIRDWSPLAGAQVFSATRLCPRRDWNSVDGEPWPGPHLFNRVAAYEHILYMYI